MEQKVIGQFTFDPTAKQNFDVRLKLTIKCRLLTRTLHCLDKCVKENELWWYEFNFGNIEDNMRRKVQFLFKFLLILLDVHGAFSSEADNKKLDPLLTVCYSIIM